MIFCELLKNSLDRVLFYNMYMHNMFKSTHSHVAALIVNSIYPFPCKTSPFFPEHKIKHLVLSIGLFRTPNRSKLHERRRKKICRTNKPQVEKRTKNRSKTTPYDATFAIYACRKSFIPPHESRCCPFLASLLQTALASDPSTCPPSCIPHFEAAIFGVAALDWFATSP